MAPISYPFYKKKKKSFSMDGVRVSISESKWIRSMIACRQSFYLVNTSMKKIKIEGNTSSLFEPH